VRDVCGPKLPTGSVSTGTPDPLSAAALQNARLFWGCCVVLLVSPRHLPRWPKLRSGVGLRLTSSLEVEATQFEFLFYRPSAQPAH